MLGLVGECQGPSTDLFALAEAHLHLWLARRQAQLLTPAAATSTALNAAARLLQAAASQAAALAEQGHDVAHFEAAVTAVRGALDAVAMQRAQQAADTYTLPALGGGGGEGEGGSPCGPGSWRCPRGVVPPPAGVRQEAEGLEAAKQRAATNLGSLPLPPASSAAGGGGSFAALLGLLKSPTMAGAAPGSDLAAQHALCTVERELFGLAAAGFERAAGLGETEVEALERVVDSYRTGGCSLARCGHALLSLLLRFFWSAQLG